MTVVVAAILLKVVLVWSAPVMNMVVVVLVVDVRTDVVIGTLTGAELIVVTAVTIASEFAAPRSYFVDVLSGVLASA